MDGALYFKLDGKKTERAVVSVKGGQNATVAMMCHTAVTMVRRKSGVG